MDHSSYVVTLRDRSVETVAGADAYAHERVMTTFYRTANARGAVDCWSDALASFRTDEILMIRRVEDQDAGGETGMAGELASSLAMGPLRAVV